MAEGVWIEICMCVHTYVYYLVCNQGKQLVERMFVNKSKGMAYAGFKPATFALSAWRSNQLSFKTGWSHIRMHATILFYEPSLTTTMVVVLWHWQPRSLVKNYDSISFLFHLITVYQEYTLLLSTYSMKIISAHIERVMIRPSVIMFNNVGTMLLSWGLPLSKGILPP